MGNKSFSLAVLPLHRFISILIFMYLENAMFFFFFFLFLFCLFFPKIILAHRKQFPWILQVMSFDLLCKHNNNKDGFYCKVN